MAACGSPPSSRTAPPPARPVRLAATGQWTEGPAPLALYRVVLPGGDTVPDLLTGWPVVQTGSTVLGFALDTASYQPYAFRFRLRGRPRPARRPAPADFAPGMTSIAISPNGRHVAYVATSGDCLARGVVRDWPDGQVRLATPDTPVPCTDALIGAATWRASGDVEFLLALPGSTGTAEDRWLRYRGRIGRPVSADTVRPR